MHPSPFTNGALFLRGQGKNRNIIIANEFIPKAIALIINVFLHLSHSILISEIRRRMDGFDGQWTLNSIHTSLDKITFSKVKIEHLKKAKELKGLVSKTQREYPS